MIGFTITFIEVFVGSIVFKDYIIKEYNKLQQNYDILDAQCRGLYNNVLMHARSTTSLFNSLNIFDSHNMRIEIIEGKGD
jgi:hypothetical protein